MSESEPGTKALAVRTQVAQFRRWVIKIGSSRVTADGRGVDLQRIGQWARDIAGLIAAGQQVVVVSSGAVAEGVARLGLRLPMELAIQQAAAAVGQLGLVSAWENAFAVYDRRTALVLLTHDDLAGRRGYLNARGTLRTLLDLGVVPIINENDTVALDELRFGDNDTLGALVANLVEADGLMLLTDQAGLFDGEPGKDPAASLIAEGRAGDPALEAAAGGGHGRLGRGGMVTKISAARLAASSGAATLIADGAVPGIIAALAAGEPLGTMLHANLDRLSARQRWIAGQLRTRGELILDPGAVRALREEGRSLLPVGVTSATGTFERGEVVVCRDQQGHEVARGLVNYPVAETRRILGQPSHRLADLLGYAGESELVHRDNLVLGHV